MPHLRLSARRSTCAGFGADSEDDRANLRAAVRLVPKNRAGFWLDECGHSKISADLGGEECDFIGDTGLSLLEIHYAPLTPSKTER